MIIQKIKITEINPAVYNPRVDLRPGDTEYEKLKNSINTFGYVEPLVWNKRTNTLVSGHQRLNVLKEQGLDEIEVSVVDLSLEKEKALNLALNKIRGDWDEIKLASLLDELVNMPEFNIDLTGFDVSEISNIIDNSKKVGDGACEDPEQIENPITQEGELVELGPHRILCGDSSQKENIDKLLGGKRIKLLWTDPPYNVDYYGGNRPHPDTARPKASRNWKKIYNDNLTQEEYEIWLEKIFVNVSGYLDKGAPIYVWNGHRQFGPMYKMLIKLGYHISCVITWAKESFAIGYGDYNQQTEFCLYGWKENNGSHRWYGPTNESTLWTINRESTAAYQHPTQKPIALASRAIKNSSLRGDIVLDTFLGSGTALIAAEGLGRICYGMEADPRYCDVIVRRYITLVGIEKVSNELKERYLKKEFKNDQ